MESNSDENQDPSQPANDAPEPHRDGPGSHRRKSARGKVEKRIKSLMETLQHLASNEEGTGEASHLPAEIGEANAGSDEVTLQASNLPTETDEVQGHADEEPSTGSTETVESPAQPESEPELSTSEEALAEIRRSLKEEQTQEKTGFRAAISRLGQRLFGRKRKISEEIASTDSSTVDEYRIPETPAPRKTFVPPQALAEHPDETQAVQEKEEIAAEPPVHADHVTEQPAHEIYTVREPTAQEEEPQPAAPSQSILAGLRQEEQAPEEDTSKIREAALEDYVTAPEEPEDEGRATLLRRLRRSWRDMRPLERRLLVVAIMIVSLAAVVGSGFLVIQSLPAPTPTPTPTLSTLPFPISVSLPGGWVFPLRTGFVQNGKWNPTGPEWLQGTEICRWVSLPWTVQLEAVLRTLKADDEIRVSMSNYDTLVYKVKSIEQVPTDQITKLAPTTPSLLVILSKQDSDTRWVVTAKP